jgi:hypothetical protein
MPRTQHFARIQKLIRLHESMLLELKSGRADRVDQLAEARGREIAALIDLGDVPMDAPDIEQIERGLVRLAQVNDDLATALGDVRDALGEQLRGIRLGRKTLGGYRKIAAGSQRGNRLGEA